MDKFRIINCNCCNDLLFIKNYEKHLRSDCEGFWK